MTIQTGTIDAADVDLDSDEIAFCIDTALSWEGTFPDPGAGDYLVSIADANGYDSMVLVSRRYLGAINHADAAGIALGAFAERRGYETDDCGELIPQDVDGYDRGKIIPCEVVRVDAVIGETSGDEGDEESAES